MKSLSFDPVYNWTRSVRRSLVLAILTLLLLLLSSRFARSDETADGIFANPLAAANLDTNAFTQWVDGAEKPVALKDGPQHVLWARGGRTKWDGVNFDSSKNAGANGNFELSIPLATLGLRPQAGQKLKGDLGVLRGNGFQTVQRVYWSNKASGIVADVPSEAELTPKLWGQLEVTRGK